MPTEPKPIDFDGLCPLLQVFDMPTSVKFYRDVLGFDLAGNSPIVHSPLGDCFHWCMPRRGSNTLMLNTAYDQGERPPAPDPARVAAHSDTALFFGCPDVDATFNELLPSGVNVLEKPINHSIQHASLHHRRPRRLQPFLPRPGVVTVSLESLVTVIQSDWRNRCR